MSSTDLEKYQEREAEAFQRIEQTFGLPADSVKVLGLRLVDPDMPYDDWVGIGHMIGAAARWTVWSAGDWYLFGEAVYGEESSQAAEGTTSDRYDLLSRVTGLAHGTLANYASLARKIPLERRRPELSPNTHGPVASLEAAEQDEWLQKAVDNAWTREELRDAIKQASGISSGDGEGGGEEEPPGQSLAERIVEVAGHIYHQAQPTSHGTFEFDAVLHSQLGAALGEE